MLQKSIHVSYILAPFAKNYVMLENNLIFNLIYVAHKIQPLIEPEVKEKHVAEQIFSNSLIRLSSVETDATINWCLCNWTKS